MAVLYNRNRRFKRVVTPGGITLPPTVNDGLLRPPVTKLSQVNIQNISRPPYLQWVTDSTYGYDMEIMRITDNGGVFGSPTAPYVLDPGYSKQQNFNVGNTWCKIGSRFLLNGPTARDGMVPFQYIKQMGTPSGTTLWSNVDAGLLWVFGGDKVVKFDPAVPSSSASTTWMDLLALGYSTQAFTVGSSEGNIDANDKHIVLKVTKTGFTGTYWIVVNLITKTVVSEIAETAFNATNGVDWVAISQSGNYVVVNKIGIAKVLYDTNWNELRSLGTGDHMDFGEDTQGREIMSKANYPRMIRLSDGVQTDVISLATMDAVYGTAQVKGGHSTGVNTLYKGWSVHSFTSDNNPIKEVFAAKNDGSEDVMRFCPMRYNRYDYDGEPQASVNRELTMVIFASNWNTGVDGNTTSNVDSYVCRKKAV